MNSRWSADSSTNDTTARQPVGRRHQRRQARIVEAHRDLGGEVLEQVAGQPELGEHDQPGALARAPARAARGGGRGWPRGPRAWARAGRGRCGRSRAESSRSSSGPRTASGSAPAGAVGRDGPRRRGGRFVAAAAEPSGAVTRCSPGRLDLLPGPLDLLGEVARHLVAARRARAARDLRVSSAPGCPSRSRSQHRVWKWQPDGGLTGDGTSPLRMIRRRRPSITGSGTGIADRSATEYGWSGRASSSLDGRQLHDPAEIHHRDPVADVAHHGQVVGDEQVRQPELGPGAARAG